MVTSKFLDCNNPPVNLTLVLSMVGCTRLQVTASHLTGLGRSHWVEPSWHKRASDTIHCPLKLTVIVHYSSLLLLAWHHNRIGGAEYRIDIVHQFWWCERSHCRLVHRIAPFHQLYLIHGHFYIIHYRGLKAHEIKSSLFSYHEERHSCRNIPTGHQQHYSNGPSGNNTNPGCI